ncbi:MAG: alkaline phosphatase family protein, partial [Chloroflexota bacterium]
MADSEGRPRGRPSVVYGAARFLIIAMVLSGCAGNGLPSAAGSPTPVAAQLALARTKIKHVVIIMQENRSFDHYFGTYPGADGIPMQDGAFSVCAMDPITGQCIKPFHDSNDVNYGGPHGQQSAVTDIDG